VRVSPWIIRQLFNESQYPRLIENGILRSKPLRNAHLTDPESVGEPHCTHGQLIRYYDHRGHMAVEVFQYLRPDNTIGASGRPDPKRLIIDNTEYIADPNLAT